MAVWLEGKATQILMPLCASNRGREVSMWSSGLPQLFQVSNVQVIQLI